MKSEKEKMIAGEPYLAGDAELVALRQNARENMRAFNDEIDPRKRSELLKNWFGKTGQKIYMEPSLSLDYGSNIFVGENFYANFNCTILDTCPPGWLKMGDIMTSASKGVPSWRMAVTSTRCGQ